MVLCAAKGWLDRGHLLLTACPTPFPTSCGGLHDNPNETLVTTNDKQDMAQRRERQSVTFTSYRRGFEEGDKA